MKAWLAFYVTENGERKSKTFSTRKLGMEVILKTLRVFKKHFSWVISGSKSSSYNFLQTKARTEEGT
jgi:hypothetical protein